MFNKIKAVKDLRSQAKQMQKTLASITATGSGADGALRISIDGNQTVVDVQIDDEILGDRDRLRKGIAEALAAAQKDIQKDMAKAMQNMGGMEEMFKNLGM